MRREGGLEGTKIEMRMKMKIRMEISAQQQQQQLQLQKIKIQKRGGETTQQEQSTKITKRTPQQVQP